MGSCSVSFLTFPPTRGLLDRTLVPPAPGPHTPSPRVFARRRRRRDSARTLVLGWDVSERALRSAYRRLALEHHPDKGGDPVRFQLIVTAYEALMNRLHGHPDF